MPKVSVIVPVYNVESFLPQCIDSIRRQTLPDIEIICVIDGSTDRSESILRLYEKVEPRLRIIPKRNGGLSSARNAGIDASSSPILMFADSDDLITSDACEIVYAAIESCDAEVVTFGAHCYPRFDETPWLHDVLSPRDIYYPEFSPAILFEEKSRPFVWRTAVKTELLKRTGLRFDETVQFGEDQIFHFEVYPKAHGVLFISNKLYSYRPMRPDSLMATRYADLHKKLREHVVIADRVCAAWKHDGLIDHYGSELLDWVADFLINDCMTTADSTCSAMCADLEALLPRWFDMNDIKGMKAGAFAIDFFNRLFKGNISDAERTALRKAYHDSMEAKKPQTKRTLRDKIDARLMTDEKLRAIDEKIDVNLNEKLRWLAFESGACARSLEMLRCELLAKGIT